MGKRTLPLSTPNPCHYSAILSPKIPSKKTPHLYYAYFFSSYSFYLATPAVGSTSNNLFCHISKPKEPHLPVLIVTAYDSYVADPRVSQADGYVVKSFVHFDQLKRKIADIFGQRPVNRV